MRSVRSRLMVVGTSVVLAGTAAGAILADAAPAGSATGRAARNPFHLTVVAAGQSRLPGGTVFALGVTARFLSDTRCRVTKQQDRCSLTKLQPDGSQFGVVHELGAGWSIRFRVTNADLVWDPVDRVGTVRIRSTVTNSTDEKCPEGRRITVVATKRVMENNTTNQLIMFACDPAGWLVPRMQRPAVALTGGMLSSEWTITAPWRTTQSNHYHLTWHVEQNGTEVTGTVEFDPGEAALAGLTQTGRITNGSLLEGKLDVILVFGRATGGGQLRGEYAGTITAGLPIGQAGTIVHGTAWNPDAKATISTWTGSGPATCFGPCK